MNVYKITLSSGKILLLREQKISDIESAASIAGKNVGDNNALLGVRLQKEMLKLLMVEVGGKKPTMTEREMLDTLFTPSEYMEATRAVQKISSAAQVDEQGNEKPLSMEFVSTGEP